MARTVRFNEAGALPACARMAWSGIEEKAKVQAGMRVLIHGAAGGIGNLALQFAKAYGAYVMGTASLKRRLKISFLRAFILTDYFPGGL